MKSKSRFGALWYGTGSVSDLEIYNMHIVDLQVAYAPRAVFNRHLTCQ